MTDFLDAHVLRNEGWACYATKNYAAAIYRFNQCLPLFKKQKSLRDEVQVLKGLMLCKSILGENEQALEYGRTAYKLLKSSKKELDNNEKNKFLHNYAVTLCKNEQYNEAWKIFKSISISSAKAYLVYQGLANCCMFLKKYSNALSYFEKALSFPSKKYSHLYILEQKASCLHKMGRHDESVEILKKVIRKREQLGLFRDWTYFHLASSLEALGKKRQAYNNYKKAARYSDSLISLIFDTGYRKTFFEQKLEIFERLVETALSLKEYSEAYYYARMSKGKIFREEILKSEHGFSDMPEIKREKELREEMESIAEAANINSEKIRKLEEEYDRITKKLEKKDWAKAVFGSPLELKEIQEILPARTKLLDYYLLKNKTAVFTVTRSSFKVYILPAGKYEAQQFKNNLRNFIISGSNLILKDYKWYASLFYKSFLSPLKNSRSRNIVISPHKDLHSIPFCAICNEKGKYLNSKHTLSYTPSPLVLKLIFKRKRNEKLSFLGIADSQNDLAGARQEIEKTAKLFNKKKLFMGEQATHKAVTRKMPEFSNIHFACHGIYNTSQPLKSHLVLHDKPLFADEVLEIDLRNAQIAVLSSCSSGLGSSKAGDNMEGLSRSFLLAGCNSLVCSLWEIPDEPTKILNNKFYNFLIKGKNPAEALRAAVNICEKKLFHPRYWAAFKLIGRF